MSPIPVLLVVLLSSGCGGSSSPGLSERHQTGGCGETQAGILVLSWTLHGATASATSCSGVDHLEVELSGSGCEVTISPVPCALDHWRYDHLPGGPQQATVTAVDAAGRSVASGVATVDLTSTAPASPTEVELD
jgi:hypothetical protein